MARQRRHDVAADPRISELRDAVESAAEELDVTPPEHDDVPSFRERLARAADARHRAATS